LTGWNVMFYFTGNNTTLEVMSGADVELTAPSSGHAADDTATFWRNRAIRIAFSNNCNISTFSELFHSLRTFL
ncbi:MAG: hypothetical protein V3V97_22075, partial [Hyphomicrobiaceae bacterium]